MECNCKKMSRGTTPSLYFNISVPCLGTEKYYITFQQRNTVILEKVTEDVIVHDQHTIKVNLSQEETLLFSSKYPIEVQIRMKYTDGSAIASDTIKFYLNDIIKEGVI